MAERTLEGKVALITGASRGLGKAIAHSLGRAGARLVLVARNRSPMDKVVKELEAQGVEALPFSADVSVEWGVQRMEEWVTERVGRIDILVNNAGINLRKPITEFTMDEWQRVITANLTSVFLMCRAFVPHLKGRGYGRIINLTSIMSHVGLPGRTAYCASKTGVLGLTRALALELAADGITVNGISPGPFATEMNKPIMENPELNQQFISRIPVGRWGRVEEVGELAAYLCSPGAGFITGTDFLIDGGWTAQ